MPRWVGVLSDARISYPRRSVPSLGCDEHRVAGLVRVDFEPTRSLVVPAAEDHAMPAPERLEEIVSRGRAATELGLVGELVGPASWVALMP